MNFNSLLWIKNYEGIPQFAESTDGALFTHSLKITGFQSKSQDVGH